MEDTLSIVVIHNGEHIMVNLEAGKVVGGSVTQFGVPTKTLKVIREYDLCGYPYTELATDDPEEAGVLA